MYLTVKNCKILAYRYNAKHTHNEIIYLAYFNNLISCLGMTTKAASPDC